MNIDNTRLEMKVDELTKAINKLVLFEERQTVQALAILENSKVIKDINERLTERVEQVQKKLDMWVNRGVGAWALAGTMFTLYKLFMPV